MYIGQRESEQVWGKVQDFWQSKDLCSCLLFYTWKARREKRKEGPERPEWRRSGWWRGDASKCSKITDFFRNQTSASAAGELSEQQLVELVGQRNQNFPGGFWCPAPPPDFWHDENSRTVTKWLLWFMNYCFIWTHNAPNANTQTFTLDNTKDGVSSALTTQLHCQLVRHMFY